MKKLVTMMLVFLALPAMVDAQDKYPRGRVQSPDHIVAERHYEAFQRHRYRVMVKSGEMQAGLPDEFNASALGWTTGSATNQGNCGDCFGDSAARAYSSQRKKGGFANIFTYQYGLDWVGSQGGCNGGDEMEVIDYFKRVGWPDQDGYPYPYIARPGGKRAIKGPMVKLDDYGYCTPAQTGGIAATEDIMAMIMLHGEVSTAVYANGQWDNYNGGIMPYTAASANSCNHAITIYGWKKDASVKNGGYWLARNNWGTQWGIKGDLNIPFKSHAIGTEAGWLSTTPLAPPPPDPPNPPPPPPVPPPTPVGNNSVTFTIDGVTKTFLLVDPGQHKADADALEAILRRMRGMQIDSSAGPQVVPSKEPMPPAKLPEGPKEEKKPEPKPEPPPEAKPKPKLPPPIDGEVSGVEKLRREFPEMTDHQRHTVALDRFTAYWDALEKGRRVK